MSEEGKMSVPPMSPKAIVKEHINGTNRVIVLQRLLQNKFQSAQKS